MVAQQRAGVTSHTKPLELFETLKQMIEPLRDIHTGIEAPKIKRTFDAKLRPAQITSFGGTLSGSRNRQEAVSGCDKSAYFPDPPLSLCHGQWQYGLTESGIGYLRILQFGGYSRRHGFDANVRALNRALDRILGNSKLRGLIIDVRLSFGGDDRLGLAIAARLTATEYMAYAIQARADPAIWSIYTPLQPVLVQSGNRPIFMERIPPVVRIGENTQGVFADVLDRGLPNGWTFGLPNAVYRTSDGRAFDVSGIPPDVPMSVFADDDVAAGRDEAMAAAMRILAGK